MSTTNPFLKWPGGKRWLASKIFPSEDSLRFNRYFEPFLGGAAFFFYLKPKQAMLSDINFDLINTYCHVKQDYQSLIDSLRLISCDKETFYRVRSNNPSSLFDRAVRFLYLNRTAFSGMFRVNRHGHFNVPYGGGQRTPRTLWTNDLLKNASESLKNTTLLSLDFEEVLNFAESDDLVYCDPTYTTVHNSNNFIRYNETNFSWADQKRLAGVCESLSLRRVKVLVSNALHKDVIELYPRAKLIICERKSLISPNLLSRKCIQEALFDFSGILSTPLVDRKI